MARISSLITLLAAAATTCLALPQNQTLEKRAQPMGIDVSHFQGAVNFNAARSNGISFAYIKATEGTSKSFITAEGLIYYLHTPTQVFAL